MTPTSQAIVALFGTASRKSPRLNQSTAGPSNIAQPNSNVIQQILGDSMLEDPLQSPSRLLTNTRLTPNEEDVETQPTNQVPSRDKAERNALP